MSPEIIIAVIASLTSLLVGVTTLIIAVLNNRHSTRSLLELEKLKNEFSRASVHEGKSDIHVTEYLQALHGAIQAIQKVKDETQIALQAFEMGQDIDLALREIIAARERMFACYEQHLAVLSKHEANLLHDAKNISLLIEKHLRILTSRKDVLPELSNENKEKLAELRARLTDVQQGFRDGRAELILKRLGLPLSWLNDIAEPLPETVKDKTAELRPAPASSDSSLTTSASASNSQEADSAAAAGITDNSKSLQDLRILLVEDGIDMRELLTWIFIRQGADVKSCITAIEALYMLEQWKPHILLSDINLPREDGYALIRKVRELKPEKGGLIPAIALTAYDSESDRESTLAAGYQRHIAKASDLENLMREIRELTGWTGAPQQ